MSVTSEKTNEAMARFLVHRYEQIVGYSILNNENSLNENTIEMIQVYDSEFL